jgi:hypothetical protein
MAGPGRYDWSNGVLVAAAPYAPGMGNSSLGSSSGGFPNPWTACWRACQKPFLILPHVPFAAPARLIVRVRSKGTILGEAVNGGSFKGMHFYDLPTSLPESADIDLILDPGYKFSARISPDDVPRGP